MRIPYHNRNSFRRTVCLFAAILLLALSACTYVDGNTPEPSAEESPVQNQIEQTSPLPESTPALEPQYRGDGTKYTCIMTDARDRRWEEEIVSFADTFLNYLQGHPKLTERSTYVRYETSFRHPEGVYESLFDAKLREEFIRRVNLLIASIDSKSDSELLLGCSEITAILNDAHSNITLPLTEVFPLGLIPIYTDAVPEAYIYAAPTEHSELLLCRLDAINGVSVPEIMARAEKLIPHESVSFVYHSLFSESYSRFVPCLLLESGFLRYIGVLGEENVALFTVTDGNGMQHEVTLRSVVKETKPEMTVYQPETVIDESISFDLMYENREASGWYKLTEGGKVLYIRLNICADDADTLCSKAVSSAAETGELKTVIVDLRGNPGGNNGTKENIAEAINSLDTMESKYVLIDGGTASAAVSIAVALKRFCKDAVLVGTPAGEPPNGVFQTSGFASSNRYIQGHISVHKCFFEWPAYEELTLMPDITVAETAEDFKNGIDSVLKYVMCDSALTVGKGE